MMAVCFTDRELRRAWENNLQAFQESASKSNAHRLLLFYAVECGLKLALMKREGASCTADCPQLLDIQHDINALLDALKTGRDYNLPKSLSMGFVRINQKRRERKISPGQINQMWRYGGHLHTNSRDSSSFQSDIDIEKALLKICQWLEDNENL
ncbi:hypothetical protein E1H12_15575 [Geitlerinema sp. P-1104]|nr:hypothetical protein [Geitlerinema sp. P-1104]